jgi:hypothetical protein
MMDWSQVLSGYNVYQVVLDNHDSLLAEALGTGFFVKFYLQLLANMYALGKFIFQAFPSLLLILMFLAFWYIVFIKPARRFARL